MTWFDVARVAAVVVLTLLVWPRHHVEPCGAPEVTDVAPAPGTTVGSQKIFTGTTACLAAGDEAYVVVAPDGFAQYYPQGEAIHGNGRWSQPVTFGGQPGETFYVFVVLPDNADQQQIEDYLRRQTPITSLPGSKLIYEGKYEQ